MTSYLIDHKELSKMLNYGCPLTNAVKKKCHLQQQLSSWYLVTEDIMSTSSCLVSAATYYYTSWLMNDHNKKSG